MKNFLLLFLLLLMLGSLKAQPDFTFHVGGDVGGSILNGDVQGNVGISGGISVQAHYNYVGLRIRQEVGQMTGMDHTPSTNYGFNPAWLSLYDGTVPIYYNYLTNYTDVSFQLVLNVLGKRFYEDDSRFTPYVLGGIGWMSYRTYVDAFEFIDGVPTDYDFSSITVADDRSLVVGELKALLDRDYETLAEGQEREKRSTNSIWSVGAGMKFRVNAYFLLSLEYTLKTAGDDLLDGQQWDAPNQLSDDTDTYSSFSLGVHYILGSRPSSRVVDEDKEDDRIIRP